MSEPWNNVESGAPTCDLVEVNDLSFAFFCGVFCMQLIGWLLFLPTGSLSESIELAP